MGTDRALPPTHMDRNTILEHLALAQRHVREAEQHVDRQRQLIAELERDGHDVTLANALLDQMEQLYVMHMSDRDRLQKEADKFPP
jgi:hypothetical protein